MTFRNKKKLYHTKKEKKDSKGISYSGGGFKSRYNRPLIIDRPYTEQEINFQRQCNSQVYKIVSPNVKYDGLITRTLSCVYGSLADIYIALTEIKKTSPNLKLIKVSFKRKTQEWFLDEKDFTIKEFYDRDRISSSSYGQICTATYEEDNKEKFFFMNTILDNKENLEKFKKDIEDHYRDPFRVLVDNSCKH